MYQELMNLDFLYRTLFIGMLAFSAFGVFVLRDWKGYPLFLAAVFICPCFVYSAAGENDAKINHMPYQQEKAAIIAEATNIDCCVYRDADGNYFFLHEFNISEKDFAENGPKFIRVDIPMEDAATVMAEISLLPDSHNCNAHYNFTPFEEAVQAQYLSEHPKMADDYEEMLLQATVGNATKIGYNLYVEDGQYFMVDASLTTRIYVSEEEAHASQKANIPQHVHG